MRPGPSDPVEEGVDRRCPACGALVAPDAAWCGQCYTELRPARDERPATVGEPRPSTASPPPPPAAGAGAAATAGLPDAPTADGRADEEGWWPCAVCGARNPIALDACERCGTAFADTMREAPQTQEAEPREALAWSLIFPGLGHRVAGRPLDGLARGVLFAMSSAMALLLGLAGVRSGTTLGVFVLFLVTALLVYAGSALEAYRIAQGGDVLVSSRILLWILVGLILLSVVMLALAVATSGSG